MEGKSRDQANDSLGQALCRLCQAMMCIQRRIGELIKPARQTDDLAISLHAADRCGGDAGSTQLCQTRDSTCLQKGVSNLTLGGG